MSLQVVVKTQNKAYAHLFMRETFNYESAAEKFLQP